MTSIQELESRPRNTRTSFRRQMRKLLNGESEITFEANEPIRGLGKDLYLGHEDVQTPMLVRARKFKGGLALSFESGYFSVKFELTKKGPQIYRAGDVEWLRQMAIFPNNKSKERAFIVYGNELVSFAQQHKPSSVTQ